MTDTGRKGFDFPGPFSLQYRQDEGMMIEIRSTAGDCWTLPVEKGGMD